ncbi:DUF1338 domain-containing protein [Pleionea sp. CnH1-48]|uniref:DUF1338 domain-containing protein n=1 Tax=Pleionea sp. CnH1-48 TaxID=2954494 RepID=UPI0020969E15|nr:DUF1338 domain-containing protein [Pleionea sp. CnH1-48]MCO7224970.1 DUF1338 domain-containing protein [Pleionea sp. CnH1-48]
MKQLLDTLWEDYLALTPDAKRLHEAFQAAGEDNIINDHIALRTFNRGELALDKFVEFFAKFDYVPMDEYHFEEKKLRAYHFAHKTDINLPKIFVSELLLEEMSENVQAICNSLIEEADAHIQQNGLMLPSMPWRTISAEEYLSLRAESEYAAWLATFGLRANHFTVSVNHLTTFKTLESVNDFIKSSNFELNQSGGEIKGNEDVCLKQSSTMANTVEWEFADRTMEIRSCFYEFAQRFNIPGTSELYQGFVAASADKIFESTDVAA